MPATAAGARRLRFAQLAEQRGVLPHVVKAAVRQHVSGQEAVMDGERARVHVADGVDQAHDAARAAHVQAGQRAGLTERGQVEEGVAGEHPLALGDQPVVQLDLLVGGGVQLLPDIGAAPDGRSRVIRSVAP